MYPGLERVEQILEGDDAFCMFGIFQALHNGRDDVASRAPDGAFNAADSRSPEPGILAAPLTDGEEQSTPRCLLRTLDGAGNLRMLDRPRPLLLRPAAPVHLDIVEAPLRELHKVLFVMPLAAGIDVLRARVGVHAATVAARVRVDPGPQPQAVNVIGDVGHVAVFLAGPDGGPLPGVHDDVACAVTLAQPPAFVDDDIDRKSV